MLLTWSASVIGLSTDTVTGTVLPFSTIDGTSSLTLPGSSGASPTNSRIAAAIVSSVAPATGASAATPIPAAVNRSSRRVGQRLPSPPPKAERENLSDTGRMTPGGSLSVAQGQQERHGILDLLGSQDRLAAPCLADPTEPVYPVIRRHDRVGLEVGGVDETQPQLALRITHGCAGQIRGERALEVLLRKWAGMTQQA